jgi:hypothetical protein
VGYGKVSIRNHAYKEKGHAESTSPNLTPRVQRHHPPPKICSLPKMMEFSDDDVEEEKQELSNKLVMALK